MQCTEDVCKKYRHPDRHTFAQKLENYMVWTIRQLPMAVMKYKNLLCCHHILLLFSFWKMQNGLFAAQKLRDKKVNKSLIYLLIPRFVLYFV